MYNHTMHSNVVFFLLLLDIFFFFFSDGGIDKRGDVGIGAADTKVEFVSFFPSK